MTDLIDKNFNLSLSAPISGDAPLVAILLCTCNGAQFLAEQLDSLEVQAHQNWRVIASDDGSTDQTLEILQQYQAKWPSGKLTIRSGPQKGFCHNFLSIACDPEIKADYYAFCDQDDVWLPFKLTNGISSLKLTGDRGNSTPMLYGGKTVYVDEDLKVLGGSFEFNYPKVFRNALVQAMAGGNTLIFNQASKALLEKTSGVDPASHDWWLYLLVSGAGGLCIFDANAQVLYRQHRDSLVGENRSISAKVKRIHFLFGGRFKSLIDLNIKALMRHQSLLSNENSNLVNSFAKMRKANLLMRLRLFGVCGLFRQTRNGTIALFLAIILNQI